MTDINHSANDKLKQLEYEIDKRRRKIGALMRQRDVLLLCQKGISENNYDFLESWKYGDLYKLIENVGVSALSGETAVWQESYFYRLELFEKYKKKIIERNLSAFYEKKVLKVSFVLYSAAMWSCKSIYDKLNNDPAFSVNVVVNIRTNEEEDASGQIEEYKTACKYFRDNGYTLAEGYDLETGVGKTYADIGSPDIIFYLTPWLESLNKSLNLNEIPAGALIVYIPYSFCTAKASSYFWYNMPAQLMSWKLYCETPSHKELSDSISIISGEHIVSSGYVKMDEAYRNETYNISEIWKITPETKFKIVYAPHHSVNEDDEENVGTFHKNYAFMYELAKKYSNISWIIKPHPGLWRQCIKHGVFKSYNEYCEYINSWEELPNAKVCNTRYFDVFSTSDGMIFDSISFLTEYLYFDKPSLFLTRDFSKTEDFLIEFGKDVFKCHYKAEGSDYNSIERFVNEVIISENDPLKQARKIFFENVLDYNNLNGKLACDFIYDELCQIRDKAKNRI